MNKNDAEAKKYDRAACCNSLLARVSYMAVFCSCYDSETRFSPTKSEIVGIPFGALTL